MILKSTILAATVSLLLLAGSSIAQTNDDAAVPAHSKVRIVRLSQTRGTVQIARDGSSTEPAMNNLPIVEKTRLETGVGVAEVEFEDNATLRMAPDSTVEFPQLERLPGGGTLTSVRVSKGMVYVSLMKTAGNEFTVLAGGGGVQLTPASHVRVALDGNKAQVAVLSGTVRVDTPEGSTEAAKKESVSFNMSGGGAPALDRHVASNEFDGWDKSSTEYHSRVASTSMFGNSPYSYGASDLMYYGSFMDAGGCGSMWRPYFASADWEPYSNGAWAWYEGAGYSWVSPYPWGWMPYHYGSWSYCPGVGWGWMPGGSWMGLNNGSMLTRIKGPGTLPLSPIHPPHAGETGIRVVSTRPVVRSEIAADNSFVFRKDSAGLGIPRQGLGNLSHFSHQTGTHGMASTPVYVEMHEQMNAGRMNAGRPPAEAIAGTAIRSGRAPQTPSQGPGAPMNAGAPPSSGASSAPSVSAPSHNSPPVRSK